MAWAGPLGNGMTGGGVFGRYGNVVGTEPRQGKRNSTYPQYGKKEEKTPAIVHPGTLLMRKLLEILEGPWTQDGLRLLENDKNRKEICEWLATGTTHSEGHAKRLTRIASRRCPNMPEVAEAILGLLKEAGRMKDIESVARSPYPAIAKLAKAYET